LADAPPDGPVILQYQLVDPGRYIDLKDEAFKTNWSAVTMTAENPASGAAKGNAAFRVELPGVLQVHRRLVRYRVVASGKVIAPGADDPVPNFAYFVYDGVPPWQAAINPASNDPELRKRVTFGTNVMGSLPIYQFISKKSSVENVTWYEPAPWGDDAARKKYNYTGTFVADDGKVYDHVRFRARGGEWRYAMGKNMWKFDFNRGHHFQARDGYGQDYGTKWEKLNLGACIQQATSLHRGEHGMFEAVGFKLFNLAGVEAPNTHWVHLRIIDEAEENPSSQYGGDFWGLYLATEDMADQFLKEHRLPQGNLYKLEFGRPQLHTKPEQGPPNNADVRQFMAAYRTTKDEQWWRENLDLPRYYSYRSILECIHHYDIYAGKNYFYYHNPQTGHWSVLPWDIDLSWADNMHGTGQEPFYRAGLLLRPTFKLEFQNRLRELRDLLFNPAQTDALIDEYASFISDPAGGPSFVDADRAKWDYHPIMASGHVHPHKAGQGEFYKIAPSHNFGGMLQLMKDYVRQRGRWVDETLLADPALVPTPATAAEGTLDFSAKALKFRASLMKGGEVVFQWRLAEVTPGPRSKQQGPPRYEITALWQDGGASAAQIPTTQLEAGHTYRVRARAQDSTGRCSHWSEPVEFVVPR